MSSGRRPSVLAHGLIELIGSLASAGAAGRRTPPLPVRQARRAELLREPCSRKHSPTAGWSRSANRPRRAAIASSCSTGPITVTFRPRADGDSVAVALASMLCKYLREVCMRQFNRFWATHVPGIKPTAGYPGDAKRFFDEISPQWTGSGSPMTRCGGRR